MAIWQEKEESRNSLFSIALAVPVSVFETQTQDKIMK